MRLDHLLSKEHRFDSPAVRDVVGSSAVGIFQPASVVGVWWVQMTNVEPARESVGDGLPDTLLGFETTGLCPLRGVASRGGVGVLLPHFGGGVWCLICG